MEKSGSLDLRASDVFSYGCVVWAIVTGKEPWAGVGGENVIAMIEQDPTVRLDLPVGADETVLVDLIEGECTRVLVVGCDDDGLACL